MEKQEPSYRTLGTPHLTICSSVLRLSYEINCFLFNNSVDENSRNILDKLSSSYLFLFASQEYAVTTIKDLHCTYKTLRCKITSFYSFAYMRDDI